MVLTPKPMVCQKGGFLLGFHSKPDHTAVAPHLQREDYIWAVQQRSGFRPTKLPTQKPTHGTLTSSYLYSWWNQVTIITNQLTSHAYLPTNQPTHLPTYPPSNIPTSHHPPAKTKISQAHMALLRQKDVLGPQRAQWNRLLMVRLPMEGRLSHQWLRMVTNGFGWFTNVYSCFPMVAGGFQWLLLVTDDC